jgi:hypothetical protein
VPAPGDPWDWCVARPDGRDSEKEQDVSRLKLLALVAGLFLMFSSTAMAAGIKAKPWEFVGTVENCGVAGTDTVESRWVTRRGLPDAGKSNHALYLQKFGPTANCASAGAEIDGVEGIVLTELGFDYRNDGHCGAGAPRINVYTETTTYFFGCIYGTHSPAPDDPANWTRVRFVAGDASPALTSFDDITVTGIGVLFDEGEDQGEGFVYLDNIDINGTLIGKPGNA